jgi:Tripartite tricarboxylate transporter family receptor
VRTSVRESSPIHQNFSDPEQRALLSPVKLHRETVRILALPEMRKRFDDIGIEPVGSSPAEFSAVIIAELAKWAKVIREAGIRLD